jgi:hypothetical protein
MRIVSSATGGIGCTFAFHLAPDSTAPDTNMVSTTIYPSWHFWEQQRKDLTDITYLIFQAVLPSLVIPLIVKSTLKQAGIGLPVREKDELSMGARKGYRYPPITYRRCRLTKHPAEVSRCLSHRIKWPAVALT